MFFITKKSHNKNKKIVFSIFQSNEKYKFLLLSNPLESFQYSLFMICLTIRMVLSPKKNCERKMFFFFLHSQIFISYEKLKGWKIIIFDTSVFETKLFRKINAIIRD